MLKTKTIYIFLFSLLCLVVAIYSFMYVRNQINTKIEIVKEYRAQEEKNKNIDFLTKLKKELEEVTSHENILRNVYLEPNKLVDFISFLELEGQNMNLKVSVDKVERGEKEIVGEGMEVEKVKLSIAAEGSYSAIQSFLNSLNSLDKQISFSEFKLYKISSETGSVYSLKVIINALTVAYE